MRKNGQFDKALKYAIKALNTGAIKAQLTIANIKHSEGFELLKIGDQDGANMKFSEGLEAISSFSPEFGYDYEIADAIAAKLHRHMGDLNKAKERIMKYTKSQNPYTIYEQCKAIMQDACEAEKESDIDNATIRIKEIDDVLKRLSHLEELPGALQEIIDEANSCKERLSAQNEI